MLLVYRVFTFRDEAGAWQITECVNDADEKHAEIAAIIDSWEYKKGC